MCAALRYPNRMRRGCGLLVTFCKTPFAKRPEVGPATLATGKFELVLAQLLQPFAAANDANRNVIARLRARKY
jgi:hypothetical protein